CSSYRRLRAGEIDNSGKYFFVRSCENGRDAKSATIHPRFSLRYRLEGRSRTATHRARPPNGISGNRYGQPASPLLRGRSRPGTGGRVRRRCGDATRSFSTDEIHLSEWSGPSATL